MLCLFVKNGTNLIFNHLYFIISQFILFLVYHALIQTIRMKYSFQNTVSYDARLRFVTNSTADLADI